MANIYRLGIFIIFLLPVILFPNCFGHGILVPVEQIEDDYSFHMHEEPNIPIKSINSAIVYPFSSSFPVGSKSKEIYIFNPNNTGNIKLAYLEFSGEWREFDYIPPIITVDGNIINIDTFNTTIDYRNFKIPPVHKIMPSSFVIQDYLTDLGKAKMSIFEIDFRDNIPVKVIIERTFYWPFNAGEGHARSSFSECLAIPFHLLERWANKPIDFELRVIIQSDMYDKLLKESHEILIDGISTEHISFINPKPTMTLTDDKTILWKNSNWRPNDLYMLFYYTRTEDLNDPGD